MVIVYLDFNLVKLNIRPSFDLNEISLFLFEIKYQLV